MHSGSGSKMTAAVLVGVLCLGFSAPAHAEEEAGLVTSAARTAATVLWIVGGVVVGLGVADLGAAAGTLAGAIALGSSQQDSIGFKANGQVVTGVPGMLLAGSVPIAVLTGVGFSTGMVGVGMIVTGIVLRMLF